MPEFIDPENNLKPIPTNVALQTKEENNQETKGISLTTQQLMELIVQNRSKKPE